LKKPAYPIRARWVEDTLISFLAAFQFLTVLPALIRRPFTRQEMGRAVGWYPVVGLAIGGLLAGMYFAFDAVFPRLVSAALTLLGWVIVTRALHLDGFIDTCDALFGGYTPEDRMKILKDSRIGAFGLAGGALLLLTKFSSLASPAPIYPGLILAPVLGRWALSLAIFAYPYARRQGLGRDIKDNIGWLQVILATAIALAIAWAVAGLFGLAAIALSSVVVIIGAWYVLRLIPGLTGDSYGALCELAETAVLLFFLGGTSQ